MTRIRPLVPGLALQPVACSTGSFARGLYEFAGAFRGEDTDYLLSQQARNYMATQLPFGSLLAYLDRVGPGGSPYKSVYQDTSLRDIFAIHEDAFGRGIFGKLADKIPGVTVAPQLIDQLTGEPVPIVSWHGSEWTEPPAAGHPVVPPKQQGRRHLADRDGHHGQLHGEVCFV